MAVNDINPINPENLDNDFVPRLDPANLEFNIPVRNPNYLRKNREATQRADAAQLKARTDIINAENYNNFQLWEDAKSVNQVIPALSQYRKENAFQPDNNFMVDTKLLQENQVPLQYWDEFNGVSSKEQFDYILGNLNSELKTRQRMEQVSGVKSFAFEVGAAMTDPVQIAIGAATGGISGLVKGGSVAAKLGTAYAAGSVEGAIVGSLINQGLHTYQGMDVVIESFAGGLLSTGFAGVGIAGSKYLKTNQVDAIANEMEIARQTADAKKVEENLKSGVDVNFDSQPNVQKQVNDYAQSHKSYSFRRALEEQYYSTPEMTQLTDTWRKQNFKTLKEVETVQNKLNQLQNTFDDMVDEGDIRGIESVRNSIFTYEQKLQELSVKADKEATEFKAFEELQPIEQMQYVSDKNDELFAGLGLDDPQLKSKLDMNNIINDLVQSEVDSLNEIKSQVQTLDTTINNAIDDGIDLPASTFDEFDLLNQKLNEQESKVASLTETKPEELTESTFGGSSVGAAQVKNPELIVDYSSYGDLNESFEFESNNKRVQKVEQEIYDNVHNNVNRLPETLRWLSTVQEKLNLQGGKAALLGDLLFGRIATGQNTPQLQKTYYREEFFGADMAKPRNQFVNELNEISEETITEQKAFTIGNRVLNGVNLEGLTQGQIDLANKFNKATQQVFKKYNANRKLSVEMEKNFIQKQYGTRFQDLLEKSIDGEISLARAYKNEFSVRATRNAGFSDARREMNTMLRIYGMDTEQFNKRYPNVSKELVSALSRSDRELKQIYKDIAEDAVQSGADKTGMLKTALDEGKTYNGSTQWQGNKLDAYSVEYGNPQLVTLFKNAIESADPNTRFTRATKKNIDSGKIDETEAEVTGKPLSEIYAEAIVNHTIRRERNKNLNSRDVEDAFAMAFNDIERWIRENEESVKEVLDSDDFLTLKNQIDAEKQAAANKQGISKFTSKKIEIDYFYEMPMEGQTGQTKNVSIADFLQLDAETSMQGYLNSATSHIAFARNGINSIEDLQKLLRDVRTQTLATRDAAKSSDATAEDIATADRALTDEDLQFYNDVSLALWKGQSMIDYSNPVNKTLQYLGNYNFMRMMGKMGISQFSEWSEIVHQSGLSTMFKSIPELWKTREAMYNAKGDEVMPLAEALESLGLINDQFDAQFFNDIGDYSALIRFNEYSDVTKTSTDRYIQKGDDMFHKGSRYAGYIGSKMDKITRTMAVRAAFSELDKLARFFVKDGDVDWLARQEKNFTKRGINEDTLTEYGVTLQDLPVIKQAFDDYAVFDNSKATGNRIITGIDLKGLKRDNPQAFELLRTFSVNAQNEVVAPATIANSYKPLVSSQLMKTLFQFQTYGLQSLDHKVRHKFRTNNNVSMYLMLGAMTGFVSYALNVLVNSNKYENQEDYLKDRFSMGKVMAGSFSRSVYAWYMPAILGSAESMAFDTNYFNEATRTTGLSQGIMSNPTTDLLDSVYNVGKYAARYATTQDEEAYQQMIRNSMNVLPWASAPFVGEGLKTMAQSGRTYEKN